MDLIKKILYRLVLSIQIILYLLVISTEYLTNKKAGVMHHVYFRKYQYSKIISVENLNTLSIITLIISILFFVLFIYSIKYKKNSFYKIQAIITVILSIILILIINTIFFKNLLTYYYFIMVGTIVLVVQIIVNLILAIYYK